MEAGGKPLSNVALLMRARTQIIAFVINATRASAVAAFIGTPEMLNTLNDIASVSGERNTTFIILLLFYLAVIWSVVSLAGWLSHRIGRLEATQ
jgi:ABC-type amino acid transport system permease subunit